MAVHVPVTVEQDEDWAWCAHAWLGSSGGANAYGDTREEALHGKKDVIIGGESVNPRLHVAMHQVAANQLLTDNPSQTWQTVQRLAGLGYDWHNIMHMIASLVTEDVYSALTEHRQPDPAAYIRRLSELPGDWPPPEAGR